MSSMNFTCDVCGREVFSCTFVNGMKFCAKCYQETFGETDKDRKIADLEAKLAECEKENKTLKDIRTLERVVPRNAQLHKLSNRDCYLKGFENAISETIRTFEETYGKEKCKLIEERDKYLMDIVKAGGYEYQIEELKQQLAECEKSKESYRLQNEQHHLQLLQFYSRLGVEAFGADIHEKALETLMIMKEQLAEKEEEYQSFKKIADENVNYLKNRILEETKNYNQDKISFAVSELEKVKETAECVLDNALKNSSLNQSYYDRLLDEIDNQINELKEMK